MKQSKKISNPLTIIAIFAGLAEINGTVVLGLVPDDLQKVFLWFIILFPTVLVLVFFSILNWNPKVLYAPSDFLKDESFLENIKGKEYNSVRLDITKENFDQQPKFDELVLQKNANLNKELRNQKITRLAQYAQITFRQIQQSTKEFFDKELLTSFSYEAQAPGFYIVNFSMNKDLLKGESGRFGDSIIIQFRENNSGEIEIIAIGKNIMETDYMIFSYRIIEFVRGFIDFHSKK